MSEYHEPYEALPEDVRDVHRAIKSLMEELEAIDWYHQRIAVCSDEELKTVLAHNRDEEIEHACMALEWIRRNMDVWDDELRTWLFREGSLSHAAEGEGEGEGAAPASGDLGIGKLSGGE